MKFLDSFSHYDLTGLLLKWDSLELSADASVSYVTISDANSGGKGLEFEGTEIILTKKELEAMTPSVLAFRLALDGTVTVEFLYNSLVLGSCKIEGGAAWITDADGVETDVLLPGISLTSLFWEFKIDPSATGSFQLYRDEVLAKSTSGNFQNVGNYVNGFRLKFENVIETQLSDLFIDTAQYGIKAVGGFFPSSDIDVDMLPSSAVEHYTLLDDNPQDTDSFVTSSIGNKEILGYTVDSSDMFSITAISISALTGKDVGADESGIGVKGVYRTGGVDYNFTNEISPTSSVRTKQIISLTNPATGGSFTPEEISDPAFGVEVSLDS